MRSIINICVLHTKHKARLIFSVWNSPKDTFGVSISWPKTFYMRTCIYIYSADRYGGLAYARDASNDGAQPKNIIQSIIYIMLRRSDRGFTNFVAAIWCAIDIIERVGISRCIVL